MDSVDQLCEKLLRLQVTQIQCGTSDMEWKQELDLTAGDGGHGQTLFYCLEIRTFPY